MIRVNLLADSLETLENSYNLSIISILGEYYDNPDGEAKKTKKYYRIITSENYVSQLNDIIYRLRTATNDLREALRIIVLPAAETEVMENKLCEIMQLIDYAYNIEVYIMLEKQNYEVCKCGSRMVVVPELSELRCSRCLKIKKIIGAVFRDEQFYPQEGQKTKHGGYDTTRHYRFWIDRLQALENKTFDDRILERIEYVLTRDEYDRRGLTCENMREILKDSKVSSTSLNDHAPLLVKMFGGPSPPSLTFQEHRLLSLRFNKAMILYDTVNPGGGNKPYYPYFIYKIIEHAFIGDPVKLQLLDSIHLQSRETVIKNDKSYKEMCSLTDAESGLVYYPTDPAGRL